MRHRLVAAFAATCLLVVFAPASPVAAVQGNCVSSPPSVHTLMESSTSSPSQSRSGVSALLNVSNSFFKMCTNGTVLLAGPLAYVSIEPKFSGGDINKILQVGITECVAPPLPGLACHGSGQPHFFWAWGGCNAAVPQLLDMGPADYGQHSYAIWLDTANTWHLEVDGGGGSHTKLLPNTYISCWTGGLRKATWSFERWNVGDSVGSSGTQRSDFYNARFGVYNQGWFSPLFYGGATTTYCHVEAADDNCGVYDYDNFWGYTAN